MIVGLSEGASSNSREVVQASDILAKIERGEPVKYDGVIIEGDLNLSELDLPTEHVDRTEYEKSLGLAEELKLVRSSINITNSEIRGIVNFENVIFMKSTIFWGDKFGVDAHFLGAKFGGVAHFGYAQFVGDAHFLGAEFGGVAYFLNAEFGGVANFLGAEFGDIAYFLGAEFGDIAYFGGAQFVGGAQFLDAEFGGVAFFLGAEFGDITYFGGAQFIGAAYFLDANFVGATNFEYTDFERMYVRWGQIEDVLVYNGEAYLTLVKNFKNIGYFEDADDCYYQYRREKQAMRGWSERAKYLDTLALFSCGYGVRPLNTLKVSVILILIFGGIFKIFNVLQVSPSHQIITFFLQDQEKPSLIESLYFSMLVFLHAWPHPKLRPSGRWKYLVLLEDILGWLLLALFLVTLGNVMIR